jgi:hypothetical protein
MHAYILSLWAQRFAGDKGPADPPRQPGGPAVQGPGVQIAHGAGDTGQ